MAQAEDSLIIRYNIGLLGRWQTGNLSQFGINPRAAINFFHSNFNGELNADYQFMKAGDFTLVNDFWVNGIYRHSPERKVFPMLAFYSGYAKSYKIDAAVTAGAGAGVNLFRISPFKYLQFHVFAGYLYFDFENESAHQSLGIGTITKAAFPVGKQLNVIWQLDTYNSGKDLPFWGGSNKFILQFKVTGALSFDVMHSILFNNKVAGGIEKTNTLMQFGIQYHYH
ncbi:MAG: DUF481 domain-containing protein [Bacteroidetes bacterium]|nr:MAG: DUF481 domain-containing protein [Bacteroidota bacterium]